jgi:hypothetical protein
LKSGLGLRLSEHSLTNYKLLNFKSKSRRALTNKCALIFRIEIEENSSESDKEPHYKFLTRDGLSKAVLKIEDAVK